MISRRGLIVGILVLVVIASPIVWWLASPLFITNTVDEAFPATGSVEVASEPTPIEDAPTDETPADTNEGTEQPDEGAEEAVGASAEDAGTEDAGAEEVTEAADTNSAEGADAMPAEWAVVQQGEFRDADSSHRGAGMASIYQLGDERVLRFEEFEVTNGPDLHVLLVENPDATRSDEMGQSIDLGSLKGNVGNQNYEIPADVDLSLYRGVMIYCQPFHVVFSTAPFAE